jgi:hypothetical protein
MSAIEPHWVSLLWFAACCTICVLVGLTVAGMFPWLSRPEHARSPAMTLLTLGNTILLTLLLPLTCFYGYNELRSSTLLVVTGLIVLFAPGLFQALPSWLRDGPAGLATLIWIQLLALGILVNLNLLALILGLGILPIPGNIALNRWRRS